MFFFMIRSAVYNIIVSFLFEYPMVQAVTMTILSILMICYVLIKRPFTQFIGLVEVMLYETCILIVNLLVLVMASYDSNG